MKVLHVTPYFHGAWAYGGIPRLSYHLAASQAALGHSVDAVTTDAKDDSARMDSADRTVSGVRVRVYKNMINSLAYHVQFFTPMGLGREKGLISQYDILHVHGHRNILNTRMAGTAKKAGVPVVMQANGTLVNIERRRALKLAYDLVWGAGQVRDTDAFIAVSKAEKGQIERLGIPARRIRVIPNGVYMEQDTGDDRFQRIYSIKGHYLLYLGKITPRKGIEHAISALPMLQDRGAVLVVAGNDMGYAKNLRRAAKRLGVEDRVVFTGLVTGEMKSSAYSHALFTVYVGRDEIFGLVPWESIACGTPVIVAGDSGCGEWIAEAGAGHVVDYADPASIAKIINSRDSEEDEAMVERGRRFLSERLDWTRIASETIELYEEVIG